MTSGGIQAQANRNGKRTHIGTFGDIHAAARAYNKFTGARPGSRNYNVVEEEVVMEEEEGMEEVVMEEVVMEEVVVMEENEVVEAVMDEAGGAAGARGAKKTKVREKKKTKTGGGEKLRIFSENRGRPVALSQKTEGGPSRVECDLARLLRLEWRYLVAEIQPIGCGWG
jgi:hypothetical protein